LIAMTTPPKKPEGNYLRFPLALFHHSSGLGDYFNRAVHFAAVNAGIGYRNEHGEDAFNEKAEELQED